MRNRLVRTTALVCSLTLASTVSASVVTPPAANPAVSTPIPSLTAEQWREDLRFMAAEMEGRHANLYHTVSREKFAAAVKDLHDRIPQLQRNQIIVGMMRIAAMVGDGHTRIDPRKDPKFGFPSLPLKLYLFEDGLYVRAAKREHAGLLGARIDSIGGVPVTDAIRRASEISSRDNEIGPKLFVPLYLNMPDVLHALGMSNSRRTAQLKLSKGGRTWTESILADGVDASWPPDTDISLVTPDGWLDSRRTAQPPLWLQSPLDYHRLVDLPEQRALYVQLNMVTDVQAQTLAQFGEKIGERVRSTNPRALILDLRLNQGGNGDLRTRFVRELIKAEDADTRLFVLTWRGTFSASQFVLDDLDRLTDAVFIGEPAGSKPTSHSDAYRMAMPNSGISMRTSILWWQDGQNRSPWTWVDVATPLSFADYVNGRDPALEAALQYSPASPLQERLLKAAGGPALKQTIDDYLSDPKKRYANQEHELAMSAVQLSRSRRFDDAVLVAELATQRFPNSALAFNVLAQVAEKAGKIELARQAGRRTLAIEPNDRQMRSLLERLAG